MDVLLNTEGIFADTRAPDGTSAFDMALGHSDRSALSLLLECPSVEPKDHMLDLAARVMQSGSAGPDLWYASLAMQINYI